MCLVIEIHIRVLLFLKNIRRYYIIKEKREKKRKEKKRKKENIQHKINDY